ncbi:RNA-directed DNA polymerase, eukaryota, reverse transcriptase zinc-binding domain protein, partial [Tanacetum coccineum]
TEASKEKFKANVGIGSGFSQLHQASNLFHIDERVTWVDIEDEGKVLWVHAKEVSGWILDFVEDDEEESDSDDEIRDEGLHDEVLDDSLKYPSGFTPTVATEVQSNACNEAEIEGDECLQNIHDEKVAYKVKKTCPLSNPKEDREESICSRHFKKSRITAFKRLNVTTNERFGKGGTNHEKAKKDWVKELRVNNKVNFMSLQETKTEIIKLFNIKMCWGNFAFDYVYSPSVRYSGVYTPQELTENKMLWDYLTIVIDNWNGEVVIIGDFNEVRKQVERYDSIFNVQGADAFNSFISAAGLEEVPLGGCSFT